MMVSSLASFAPPSSGWGALYGPVKTFVNRFGDAININYRSKGADYMIRSYPLIVIIINISRLSLFK